MFYYRLYWWKEGEKDSFSFKDFRFKEDTVTLETKLAEKGYFTYLEERTIPFLP